MQNSQTTKEVKLSGTLKKVLYQNDENKYCIAVLSNGQKVCGVYFDTNLKALEGEEILLTGLWETHKKYGVQFAFTSLVIKEAEIFFFLTKIVKGVGQKLAKELLKKYTEDELCEILDNRPSELLNMAGIKDKKLTTIVTNWNKFKHLRELGSFLGQYGVTSNLINKIFQEFKDTDNLIEKITKNPYLLIKIKGIGFKKADEIGQAIGIDKYSTFRIGACINFVLNEYCNNNGNSSIHKDKLYALCDNNLNFQDENELYEEVLIKILSSQEIYQTTKNRYAPSILWNAEKKILDFFQTRSKLNPTKHIVKDFETYIQKKESTFGFVLSDEQIKAVKLINNGANTVSLVGYAGTGKSTSSRAILELLEEIVSYNEIKCMALSGIASQRISDTTGYQSATIQSEIIKIQNSDQEYFDYKVILLDEASMINSVTFYQIISKIHPDCIFIIVGDDGQLPAIGAGDILADIIKFKLSPICKLTKIYRQNELQAIATIANEIRKGKVPIYTSTYEDFKFIDVGISNYYAQKAILSEHEISILRNKNNINILNTIINTAGSYLKNTYDLIKNKQIAKALTLFQVITPLKHGTLGVENLNINLQRLFNNTKSKAYKSKTYEYKITDKIIHTKNENMKTQSMNEYKKGSIDFVEKRIFNGQLGMIIKLDFENSKAIVLYPNDNMVVFYDFNTLDYLISLAYCLTIHKTQGMEYNTALIPMTFSHFIMHNTKLLYTAITRAKKMCFVIGEKEAFESACKKKEITNRETIINDIINTNLT
ncbi:RecD-like DNA helicase YrrC [hydrothermal vent metagenome]|uniref:RecD-like DNA helicase YrrC n=1 Tax=hydrothermal vent metagenome TaxID=652676 RepID=A0A3B1DSW8_9ZZZZ